MKVYAIILFCFTLGCTASPALTSSDSVSFEVGGTILDEVVEETNQTELKESNTNGTADVLEDDTAPEVKYDEESMPAMPAYPDGPYSLELWKVMPNMKFYQPWRDEWIELSDFFLHEEHKALLVVSSAGWCGPCLQEAASLVGVYNEYHEDGLEIIYTLGNTNIPGDAPFDDPEYWQDDIFFMEMWESMTSQEANKVVGYQMYADPDREFIKYFPNHAWPLSMLVTTKDMGIRLVEEGYWSALMENKIMLVLYNDVPNIPFN